MAITMRKMMGSSPDRETSRAKVPAALLLVLAVCLGLALYAGSDISVATPSIISSEEQNYVRKPSAQRILLTPSLQPSSSNFRTRKLGKSSKSKSSKSSSSNDNPVAASNNNNSNNNNSNNNNNESSSNLSNTACSSSSKSSKSRRTRKLGKSSKSNSSSSCDETPVPEAPGATTPPGTPPVVTNPPVVTVPPTTLAPRTVANGVEAITNDATEPPETTTALDDIGGDDPVEETMDLPATDPPVLEVATDPPMTEEEEPEAPEGRETGPTGIMTLGEEEELTGNATATEIAEIEEEIPEDREVPQSLSLLFVPVQQP